jgi:hypothetical protein
MEHTDSLCGRTAEQFAAKAGGLCKRQKPQQAFFVLTIEIVNHIFFAHQIISVRNLASHRIIADL